MINYVLLVSRQGLSHFQNSLCSYRPTSHREGKLRLAKWFVTLTAKAKAKTVQDVTQLALGRRQRMCNFIEYKGRKVVYRRYASLFFICEIGEHDNELVTLEIIHRYVESLDRYFGNVCELDLIFNFQQAYAVLDELIIAGEMQETSRKVVLKLTKDADEWEGQEYVRDAIKEQFMM